MTPNYPSSDMENKTPEDLWQALEEFGSEVIGPQEARRLVARINETPDAELSSLHRLLQEDYGLRGGQGVALRLGRAGFRHTLRRWGESQGLTGTEFRLQPSGQRIRSALKALGRLLQMQDDATVELSEDALAWSWRVERCPACRGRTSSEPDCHLLTGMLQETLAWAGGGRIYQVREVQCSAMGAPVCLFEIVKKPLE